MLQDMEDDVSPSYLDDLFPGAQHSRSMLKQSTSPPLPLPPSSSSASTASSSSESSKSETFSQSTATISTAAVSGKAPPSLPPRSGAALPGAWPAAADQTKESKLLLKSPPPTILPQSHLYKIDDSAQPEVTKNDLLSQIRNSGGVKALKKASINTKPPAASFAAGRSVNTNPRAAGTDLMGQLRDKLKKINDQVASTPDVSDDESDHGDWQ